MQIRNTCGKGMGMAKGGSRGRFGRNRGGFDWFSCLVVGSGELQVEDDMDVNAQKFRMQSGRSIHKANQAGNVEMCTKCWNKAKAAGR